MSDSGKILIVDDEIDLCLLLKDYFVRLKYEVMIAHSLLECGLLLKSYQPDILFLDNNLPDGTGWNVAPVFATDFPYLYIVLTSAFHPNIPEMPAKARFQVIEKPIGFADLDKQFANFKIPQ